MGKISPFYEKYETNKDYYIQSAIDTLPKTFMRMHHIGNDVYQFYFRWLYKFSRVMMTPEQKVIAIIRNNTMTIKRQKNSDEKNVIAWEKDVQEIMKQFWISRKEILDLQQTYTISEIKKGRMENGKLIVQDIYTLSRSATIEESMLSPYCQ